MPNGVKQEASAEQKKLLPIRILQILEEETDVDHPLTQEEIRQKLESRYGLFVDRKSIGRNLQLLQTLFEKDAEKKGVAAVVLETGSRKGSFLDKRLFEDDELRLLIDGVLASKHIPENYTKNLITKLCSLSNKYFQSRVRYVSTVDQWGKSNNKELFLNVATIDAAIGQGKKITFDYNKYGTDKKLHKTFTHKESPYQLILKNQKYYLMYGNEKRNNVGFLRVDKISDIKIVDEPILSLKKIKGYEYGINYKKIMCSLPYMFGDPVQPVTFIADVGVIDYIIDDFGTDITIYNVSDDKAEVTVRASLHAMEYWAMQYLNHVEIKSPETLREKIKANIENAKEKYE